MRCLIVIPARMASTRFPGKPLADLCGKPMIQWVAEAAQRAQIADAVLVATPDPEIVEACGRFGVEAILTSNEHPSGTDRLAEVARNRPAEVYVNVQGDEPLVDPATIRTLAQTMLDDPTIPMASVFVPLSDPEAIEDPSVVKVVTDLRGNALYFSRHAIPYARNLRVETVKKHLGLYAFRRETLLTFAGWSPTPLEQTESLEQLRFLENGVPIRMAEGRESGIAVDLPEHAERVRAFLAEAQS